MPPPPNLQACVDAELSRYQQVWQSIEQNLSAQIIQNNFELPPYAILGNLDPVSSRRRTRFFLELNTAFARAAEADPRLAPAGPHWHLRPDRARQWFDWDRYFSYKILFTAEASVAIARSLASIVRAIYGKTRKVLVLDLDNTLWGGVIGDDGVDKIRIGRETPVAEAYTAFQEYCLSLQQRGVLLAVCSKNNEEIARQGFEHPDSVLKLEHFSSFKANWEPKHENILAIARELNLGVDSFVFVDDNPAERAIVEAQIPSRRRSQRRQRSLTIRRDHRSRPVLRARLPVAGRSLPRRASTARTRSAPPRQAKFANYGEYLDSLEMTAEIERFKPIYLDRIAQLTNKTNQFNLTTRRYTLAEMEAISQDPAYIGIYGKLSDRFGDNGLISIVLGRREDDGPAPRSLADELPRPQARYGDRHAGRDCLPKPRPSASATLRGYYMPTKKNGMVSDHYEKLGFEQFSRRPETNASIWTLNLADYTPRTSTSRFWSPFMDSILEELQIDIPRYSRPARPRPHTRI